MRKAITLFTLAAWAVLAPQGLASKPAKAGFDKVLEQLRQDPSDMGLRKQLLELAREQKTLPDVPDQVLVLKGKAAFVMKSANSPADYQGAIEAYKQAIDLAPWVGDLYYNKGVVDEKGGLPGDAITDFNLYLTAKPDADDKDKVLERLGKLDVQLDKKKQVAVQQQKAAVKSVKMQAYEGKKTAAAWVIGLGVGGMAVGFGVALGGASSIDNAVGYSTPGIRNGTNYNISYNSKYYSKTTYAEVKDGESLMGTGWTVVGVGAVATLIGVIMLPGSPPSDDALLNLDSGKLAWGAPQVRMNLYGGPESTLLRASF